MENVTFTAAEGFRVANAKKARSGGFGIELQGKGAGFFPFIDVGKNLLGNKALCRLPNLIMGFAEVVLIAHRWPIGLNVFSLGYPTERLLGILEY